MQLNIDKLLLFSKLYAFHMQDFDDLLEKTSSFVNLKDNYKDLKPFISPVFELQTTSSLRLDQDNDNVVSDIIYKTPCTF
jgi:hypothetical protein